MKETRREGSCKGDGCNNDANPNDWRGLRLECNPSGDSLVGNNDPSYQAWLARADY